MKIIHAIALVAAVALPNAALAQGSAGTNSTAAGAPGQPGSPATPQVGAGQAGSAAGQLDPQTFVQMATSSNMLEIESSRLAQKSSKRQDVRAFADMMVDDHTNATKQMQQAVAASGGARSAATSSGAAAMMPQHKQMLDQLAKATGDQFDMQYIQLQRQAHQEAVALFTNYAQSGTDQALKQFAVKTLPVLQKHAEAANALGR